MPPTALAHMKAVPGAVGSAALQQQQRSTRVLMIPTSALLTRLATTQLHQHLRSALETAGPLRGVSFSLGTQQAVS